jgi:phosphatidylethanolamine-binding protein (PEBP) family uncharacterized protein
MRIKNISWDKRDEQAPKTTLVKEQNDSSKSGFYSMIFYDRDAPHFHDPENAPYVHYLKVNLPRCSTSAAYAAQKGAQLNRVLMSYEKPSPLSKLPHRYRLLILESREPIMGLNPKHASRTRFPVKEFLKSNQLTVLSKITWVEDGRSH